jgi:hypothetical protein
MSSNVDKKAVEAKDAKAAAAGATQIEACDLLCSLGECASLDEAYAEDSATCEKKGKKGKGCAKQHQLPMFLSSKYFDGVSCLQRSSYSHCMMSLLFQEQ